MDQTGRAVRDWHVYLECRHEIWRPRLWHARIHARHANDRPIGAVLQPAHALVWVCAANVPDGQAMWETSNSLWAALQSGTNMVYHAAGWLEGGLIASPEKFVMDCEVLQQMQRYLEPQLCDTSPDALAIDTIREVGPNGHFFGTQHTQDRYTTAFYQPFVSDWRNYEAWEAAGAVWTPERAHRIYKDIIANFEEPPMDVAIRDELADFVARRKAEGGAPTDF